MICRICALTLLLPTSTLGIIVAPISANFNLNESSLRGFVLICFCFDLLGLEPWVSHILCNYFKTELHPSHSFFYQSLSKLLDGAGFDLGILFPQLVE